MPKIRRPLAVVVSDRAPSPGQHFQSDTTFGQVMNKIDEMPQIAAEPVELPR